MTIENAYGHRRHRQSDEEAMSKTSEEFDCVSVEVVPDSYGLRLVKLLNRLHGEIELKGYGTIMGFGNWPATDPGRAGAFVPGKRYRLTVEEL